MRRLHVRVLRIGAGALLALGGLAAAAPVAHKSPSSSVRPTRTFQGKSLKGNLQEALEDAVASGLRSLPGADRMVRYRVHEISGESGGIAGRSVVRVSIEIEAP